MNKNHVIVGVTLCFMAAAVGCGQKEKEIINTEIEPSTIIDFTIPPTIEPETTEPETTTEEIIYEEPVEYYYEPGPYEEYVEYEYYEYSPYDLMYHGVIYWGGWKFTWYSENVLPGGGLDIPGRWSDGNFVRDGYGNFCVASSDLPYGTTIMTPWGNAVVYDSGCASGTIDIYTSW